MTLAQYEECRVFSVLFKCKLNPFGDFKDVMLVALVALYRLNNYLTEKVIERSKMKIIIWF